jgi:hypothetical protein
MPGQYHSITGSMGQKVGSPEQISPVPTGRQRQTLVSQ